MRQLRTVQQSLMKDALRSMVQEFIKILVEKYGPFCTPISQCLKCKIRGWECYIQASAPDNGCVPFPSIITIWGEVTLWVIVDVGNGVPCVPLHFNNGTAYRLIISNRLTTDMYWLSPPRAYQVWFNDYFSHVCLSGIDAARVWGEEAVARVCLSPPWRCHCI